MNTPTGRAPADTPNMQSLPTGSEEGKRVTAAFRPKIEDEPFVPGQITITASPRFYISLTATQIAYLVTMSMTHYDGRCQSASQTGGFIRGWANWVVHAPNGRQSMDSHELDTLMKICENARVLHDPVKMAEIHLLVRLLNRAWTAAQSACSAINIELMPQTLASSNIVPPGYSPY